ncbi:MAG: kelch repeat-containing protein [Acidobacteriota bacterium]
MALLFFALFGCGGGGSSNTTQQPPPAIHNQWAWMSGSNAANQAASYGTRGVASASNVPGARAGACSWTDTAGNFWLFSGYGVATTSNAQGDLNDLWEYSKGSWTWMGGSNQFEQPGSYGTQGVPTSSNIPGARWEAECWTDPQGNFWIYGGLGIDSQGTRGDLGDLWKYSNGQWTWINGSNVAGQLGTTGAWQGAAAFGTKGVAAASNTPGTRIGASTWADPSGNLWLFGGMGVIPNGTYGLGGNMNDLWRYSNGMWTWMAGSNLVDQYGTYGTQGTPSPDATPGTRSGASAWTDAKGNLWLFGGLGVGAAAHCCLGTGPFLMNDLWEFSPSLNEWTWVGGPDEANEPGVYGTQGVAAASNLPPPRELAVAWTDSEGNFWLFGGDWWSDGSNDLWKYKGGQWTWMSGGNQTCQAGIYGTLGTPSATNVPGARLWSVGWIDKSDNLWLFGGSVFCPGQLSTTKLNDLWEYQP